MSEAILVERSGHTAWVRLNEPARRNPLTAELIPRMLSILDELEDDDDVRAVVLTGSGKAFCAGADLGAVLTPGEIGMEHQFRLVRGFNRVVWRMRTCDLPIVGAINGVAVGGGAALALACDFSVASEEAVLHFAFGRVGLASSDMGCTWLLPRLVGGARARHLLLTGARVDAARGRDLGLFAEVVAPDALDELAGSLADEIARAAPRRAVAATKMALERGEGLELGHALEYEAYVQSYMCQTGEHRARLADFLDRKKR